MELTGKCKEEFEKWLFKNLYKDSNYTFEYILELFYSYIPSMRYGVLVDYFDSVGIIISIRNIGGSYWYVINYPNKKGLKDRYEGKFMSRTEARTASIEKADELRNQVLNK